jgi:hypothetical protein
VSKPIEVTITGADDGVDPRELVELSRAFPFVEWAILTGSLDRFGTPRYPSLAWLDRFRALARAERLRAAAHLCGSPSRSFQTGRWGVDEFAIVSAAFQRVQVNGWVSSARHVLVGVERPFELIIQCPSLKRLGGAILDAVTIGNATVLLDASGGRGVEATTWARLSSAIRLGYAGGIGPGNVERVLHELGPGPSCWIDMESGVRTDDRFDLSKVRDVLEKVARWNARGATP